MDPLSRPQRHRHQRGTGNPLDVENRGLRFSGQASRYRVVVAGRLGKPRLPHIRQRRFRAAAPGLPVVDRRQGTVEKRGAVHQLQETPAKHVRLGHASRRCPTGLHRLAVQDRFGTFGLQPRWHTVLAHSPGNVQGWTRPGRFPDRPRWGRLPLQRPGRAQLPAGR